MPFSLPHRFAFRGARGVALAVVAAAAAAILFAARGVRPTAERSTLAAAQSGRASPAQLVPTEPDYFHPDRAPRADGSRPPLAAPAYGGRVIVRVDSMPPSLNYAIENSAVTRRMLYELNETLAATNFETLELEPDLATKWEVEDSLRLAAHDVNGASKIVFGEVSVDDTGYNVKPLSPGNPLGGPKRFAKNEVESLERGTVVTFHLRRDVVWHDGEPFDARDVYFSWALYKNPKVRCGDKRFQFEKVRECLVLDPYTVRFEFDKSYFKALANLADLFILPSHLYDLSRADHEKFDAAYHASKRAADPKWTPSADEQAAYINDNPHNRQWVGLGPYRVVEWTKEYLEARRFERYFDRARAGYLDTLRWRLIENDATAFQALINGEVDYNDRLTADDYFGDATAAKSFTDRLYKGFFYTGTYGFVCWNLERSKFQDARVRRALAMCFDFDGLLQSFYRGQAIQVTGPQSIFSPAYDAKLEPIHFDPKKADELLTAAGWYDRDGDGLRDKDGEPFTFEFAINSGSKPSQVFAARFQEELAKVGIKMTIGNYEWAAFNELCTRRKFDAAARGWVPPPEIDPEQVWHSKWAKVEGSNYCGFADPKIDALIESGQREVDDDKRYAIWRELQREIYALQPYMFLFNPARKFALSKSIHGFQALRLDPNYALRRWYFAQGTPGTRATAQ